MIFFQQAIRALDPKIVTVRDDVAYDSEENIVEYDKIEAQVKFEQMQAEEESRIQAQADAKQSALAKLMALGLTEEEALALGVR